MLVCNPIKLKASLGPSNRLMGLDVGSKTVGLAISDPSLQVATPRDTIHRTKFHKDAVNILALIKAEHIGGLVVGFPLHMNGKEGARCQSVRQFATNLLILQDIPILLWDERLSTIAVTRTMLDADMSRKRRKMIVDKLAATYILQGALNFLMHSQGIEM